MWKPFCEKGKKLIFFRGGLDVILFSRGKMEVRTDNELDYANKHFGADTMVFQQPDGSVWLHTSNRYLKKV